MRAVWLSFLFVAPLLLGAGSLAARQECGLVPGVGEACAVEGGYEAILADGSRLFTHGPDAVPSDAVLLQVLAPKRDPPCVADPERDFHSHFIYAHPFDKPDRSEQLTPSLRGLIGEANGLLHLEGSEFGAPVEYRFRCDVGGKPTISVATVPLATGEGSYTQLVNVLTALGFVNGHAKYWVWYDDTTSCTCGGIAAAPLDPDRSPANSANVGGFFGVTYGYMSARIPMHENGHNLGVVNNAAPDTSGAAHCNDGRDIMCYSDGGPNSHYTNKACTDREHFDCDHDSYFHPDPPPNTFVANRWQIGAPIDRFVQGCLYEEQDILLPLGSSLVVIPQECQGHRYAIYGRGYVEAAQGITGQPLRVYTNVFSLCWSAEDGMPLGCPTQKPWGHEGRVPEGAAHAMIVRESGEDARFTLSII